jgi:gamma-glutamyltranspeptidase/glutathione hydrolase
MLQVMQDGGNAVDAAIAGCLVQAVVEPHMTNHAGSVLFLYWDAATRRAYSLNGHGTLVPNLPPFRPVPAIGIRFANTYNPCAAIPGFMPALGAMHARFASKNWEYLCQPAVDTAEQGHVVTSFEYGVLTEELRFYTYFPSGRAFFTPNGFLPEVGSVFHNHDQAKTLKQLAKEGPEYFTNGAWARHFANTANRMGWPITLGHLSDNPPRWQDPLVYQHGEHELIQLYPPERTGVFTALVLGILKNFNLSKTDHYSKSPKALYLMAHALRYAHHELGLLNDPIAFEVPLQQWLSPDYHKMIAEVIWNSQPKIDLTGHILATAGNLAFEAGGFPPISNQPLEVKNDLCQAGSCELSIVDAQGNWVQMMNTLQGGGIPGVVIDGVPMVGSHARTLLTADIAGWFIGGVRNRSIVGSTLVLKNGQPWLSLGTPGNVYGTIPQVLTSILDYGIDPYQAIDLPRMDPLRDDFVLEIESRLPMEVITGMAQRGIRIQPLPEYDYNMGSFQVCWRDNSGLLNSCADPRRTGTAAGF